MLTGNKGEWSEFYVLLKLLADGKLYAADKNVKRIENFYFPILSIHRTEKKDKTVEYELPREEAPNIAIYLNNDNTPITSIDRSLLAEEARTLYDKIVGGNTGTFAIPCMEGIMEELLCEKLKAPSADKTDILLEMHDIQTGYNLKAGFSIKSELGSAPTLLNASRHTNFIYKVTDINNQEVEEINAIEGRTKIIDRMQKIFSSGQMSFVKAESDVFQNNLMFIDTQMDKLIGEALMLYGKDNVSSCSEIVSVLEDKDPLEIASPGFYEYKFKKFLAAIALGMVSGTAWNGRDEANGGYIIVTVEGDVLAYHLYNRDHFESYLLKNTKLDRASTSRYEYAYLYKDGADTYIKMNLQIRFK